MTQIEKKPKKQQSTVLHKALKYAGLTVTGLIAYDTAATFALSQRGYTAVGGEIFFLFLPIFYHVFSRELKEIFEFSTGKKESGKNE